MKYLVAKAEIRAAKESGKPYGFLHLSNAHHKTVGFMEADSSAKLPTVGLVYEVTGYPTYRDGRDGFRVDHLALSTDSWEGYVPHGSPTPFLARAEKLISLISDKPLAALCRAVVGYRKFQLYPAAQIHHHWWLGGLLAHSVDVAQRAWDFTGDELAIAAGLLHDCGKVLEFYLSKGQVMYAPDLPKGGHCALGEVVVRELCRQLRIELNPVVLEKLVGVMETHHGREHSELGCPRTELEYAVHSADGASAKGPSGKHPTAAEASL